MFYILQFFKTLAERTRYTSNDGTEDTENDYDFATTAEFLKVAPPKA